MQLPADSLSAGAIRDTISAVFAEPEFHRVAAESIMSRVLGWIFRFIAELFRSARNASLVGYLLLALTALFIGVVIVRLVARFRADRPREIAGARNGAGAFANDPWQEAQRLAAGGDYTGAAHALYAGILQAVARRGLVRLHHAKTIGDYLRELRARASGAIVSGFRDFTRVYEVVVYGSGVCDQERFERLATLAAALRENGQVAR